MSVVTIKKNEDDTYSVCVDSKVIEGPFTKAEAESRKSQLESEKTHVVFQKPDEKKQESIKEKIKQNNKALSDDISEPTLTN